MDGVGVGGCQEDLVGEGEGLGDGVGQGVEVVLHVAVGEWDAQREVYWLLALECDIHHQVYFVP